MRTEVCCKRFCIVISGWATQSTLFLIPKIKNMKQLKHITSWILWILLPFVVALILSVPFKVKYVDIVHSVPFCVFFALFSVIFTLFYLSMHDEDGVNLNFFK